MNNGSLQKILLFAAAALSWAGAAQAELALPNLGIGRPGQPAQPRSVARFDPSSPAVIDEMLRIADVTRRDLVYDLGCGDGRIVITAARTKGARGVGVDLDGGLIEKSRKNADRANVTRLVRFVKGDLFEVPIARASVVTLFLTPEGNLRLRPRLLRELKPGARIVSHSHGMGEWKPDQESQAEGDAVYLWIVPADVSGKWSVEIMDKYSPDGVSVRFEQRFQEVRARMKTGQRELSLHRPRLAGKTLMFTIPQGIGSLGAPIEFRGVVENGRISGTYRAKKQTGTWTARRIKR